jgi:hypothetical protein
MGLASAAHQGHGFVHIKGLGQIFERPTLISGHGAVEVRMRRHDDDRQFR